MSAPVSLRNIARYVKDLDGNRALYEAIGFKVVREHPEHMLVMRHADGMGLVLHVTDAEPRTSWEEVEDETAVGLTIEGDVPEARRFLEKAGFRCLREPDEGDEGFFFIYGDLHGNPINLVGFPQRKD